VILTGSEIKRMVAERRVIIEPYHEDQVEPNAYGCRLGDVLLEYPHSEIDAHQAPEVIKHHIPHEGFVLMPRRFYLGSTIERIGGVDFASELYANLSAGINGIFVQTSAPLGHTGAVIRWTLEIVVVQPVRVYVGAKLVKVCFWSNRGEVTQYHGRYAGSTDVVPSKIFQDEK
jgi:dCTP deaminase